MSPMPSRRPASSRRRGPTAIFSRSRSAVVRRSGPIKNWRSRARVEPSSREARRPTSARWRSAPAHRSSMSPFVFVGYGITAKDDANKLDYDDYAGIDVKGKAVLLIRREPQQENTASPFDGTSTTRFATFQHKATNAFQHGAVAVLFVNDLAGLGSEKDRLLPFNGAGIDTILGYFVRHALSRLRRSLARRGGRALARAARDADRQDLKPARASSRAGHSPRRSRSSGTGSTPRTSSACWKGPVPMPMRRSWSAAITTTWGTAGSCPDRWRIFSKRHPQRGRRQRLGNRHGARARAPAGCAP